MWWENLREPKFERAVNLCAAHGRIILMAGRDAKPIFPIGPFYTRDCRMYGFAMFNSPADEQRKSAAEINRWMARGRLRPRIDRVMKLTETAEAHRLQEASTTGKKSILAGKIVLAPERKDEGGRMKTAIDPFRHGEETIRSSPDAELPANQTAKAGGQLVVPRTGAFWPVVGFR